MTYIKKVYNEMIDRGFNYILDKMEPLSDNITEQEGSLSVNIKDLGEYLFNRQPVSYQLWGSSPITGPSRFNLQGDKWIQEKKNISLQEFLDLEIKNILNYSRQNKKSII